MFDNLPPVCRALLIVPGKPARAVRRELDIVRRIRIDKIIRLGLERRDVIIRELPMPELLRILRKVRRVIDLFCKCQTER